MRIISWNCHGAFRKKYEYLDKYSPDIVVVQECENPNKSTSYTNKFSNWADSFLWVGEEKGNKGVGIFTFNGVKISKLNWGEFEYDYFFPIQVNDSFNMIACWIKDNKNKAWKQTYIPQIEEYLSLHYKRVKSAPTVIVGDLNSNCVFDKPSFEYSHRRFIDNLDSMGIKSLYHLVNDEEQGQENNPTYYMYRKLTTPQSHVDYALVSDELISQHSNSFILGDPSAWLEHSDHVPLIFDITV